MDQFSISQLAQFSGVKAHTIRIWEQRYQALQPNRSEGNTRYYDADQLRRILNIVSLTQSGYKISELGPMPDNELFNLVAEHEKKHSGDDLHEFFISQLIAAGMDFDEAHFEKMFSHCLLRYGMRDAYVYVIYPFLQRTGVMWASNSLPPAREHFMSNILRQKFFTAIDALPPADEEKESWMLFLPENEFHEIGLLFANYLIRASGKKVIYLGSNVPQESMLKAVEEVRPSKLLLFFVHFDFPEKRQEYIQTIEEKYPDLELFISGNEKLMSGLSLGENTRWLRKVSDLEKGLTLRIA